MKKRTWRQRIVDLFMGELHPLKFNIGDSVSYPSEGFSVITRNNTSVIFGTIIEVKQARGIIPNYYTIESADLLHIDNAPLPVGVCEEKITLIQPKQ